MDVDHDYVSMVSLRIPFKFELNSVILIELEFREANWIFEILKNKMLLFFLLTTLYFDGRHSTNYK